MSLLAHHQACAIMSNTDTSFPFDVVLLTSPDPDAAPVQTLRPHLSPKVQLHSTSDPFGARCGSGGGTLAALDHCRSNENESILIIHAGGESSRCPTQMTLGKAFTSLPIVNEEEVVEISNPTVLLLNVLSKVFHNVPKGSIVVAASDCLLDLPISSNEIDWSVYQNAVMGVAVPAPLETAKNHGVFCIHDGNVTQLLQKPNVEEMKNTVHCVWDGDEKAWIDTGVVAYLPGAAHVLRSLASSMERCTERGLRRLYNEQQQEQHSPKESSLEEFACQQALRVELYTHLMMASSFSNFDDYRQACGGLSFDILQDLYSKLSPFPLQALAVSTGTFTHLGTSREMLDHLSQKAQVKRAKSLVPYAPQSFVAINTVIETNDSCTIGENSVLEHVHASAKTVDVGNECLVSGIRGTFGDSLTIPQGMIFQMIPIKGNGTTEHVYMYLGLDDGIKSGTTIWGMPMEQVLQRTGLKHNDVWDYDEKDTTVWKARIHPIVQSDMNTCMHNDVFYWITELVESQDSQEPLSERALASLGIWMKLPRLSLSEIGQRADAVAEFQYRDHLEKHVYAKTVARQCLAIQDILVNRLQTECGGLEAFIGLFHATSRWSTELAELVHMFDSVILETFDLGHYDIAGRASMILSELFSRLSAGQMEAVDASTNSEHSIEHAELETLRVTNRDSLTNLVSLRDSILQHAMTSSSLESCALALERCASAMTERCVAYDSFSPASLPRIDPAPLDTWVVATAPARIDLAGGWSDTPPICIEHGGAVCNVAVVVDAHKPLSCRCRLVSEPNGAGILVRSEGRDIRSGELTSETSASLRSVGDFNSYRDPRSDCSLIKCALVYCGLVSAEAIVESPDKELSVCLKEFCGADNVGLEIVTTSLLPHGSGMGTSSILGGCVLAAITKCVGIDTSKVDLNHMVLMLEQLLCTGGGWQDQAGGLIGGAKLCTSENTLPLQIKAESIPLDSSFVDTLNQRLLLVFTGQTRLAKNILQNVLRHWARRSKGVVETVEQLTTGAEKARDCLANQDLDGLSECLNAYWEQKKVMAAESSEPPVVRAVLTKLLAQGLIQAGSLCGAGGGGFMILLLKEGQTSSDIQQFCRDEISDATDTFTWHECRLCQEGLTTTLYQNGGSNAFHMSWHLAI